MIASASAFAEIASGRSGRFGRYGSVDLRWPYVKWSGRQLYFFGVRYYLSGTQITKKKTNKIIYVFTVSTLQKSYLKNKNPSPRHERLGVLIKCNMSQIKMSFGQLGTSKI